MESYQYSIVRSMYYFDLTVILRKFKKIKDVNFKISVQRYNSNQ